MNSLSDNKKCDGMNETEAFIRGNTLGVTDENEDGGWRFNIIFSDIPQQFHRSNNCGVFVFIYVLEFLCGDRTGSSMSFYKN